MNSDVNAKANLALAPDGADGKLANVGFAAMQKPKFYRERAQVAMELAELFRDQIAKQMLQRPLNVGESLRGSLGHENEAERRAKPKSGDAPTRPGHHHAVNQLWFNYLRTCCLRKKRTAIPVIIVTTTISNIASNDPSP